MDTLDRSAWTTSAKVERDTCVSTLFPVSNNHFLLLYIFEEFIAFYIITQFQQLKCGY